MLLRYFTLLLTFFIFSISFAFADQFEDLENTLEQYTIDYQQKNYFGNVFEIDVSDLEKSLNSNFPTLDLEYVWEIFSNEPQTGSKISTTFQSVGEKVIKFKIYVQIPEEDENGETEIERTLIHSYDLSVFVYEKSLPLLVSDTINPDQLNDFIQDGADLGVYIHQIGKFNEHDLSGDKIIKSLSEYNVAFPENSDYLTIWGEKEFLFSALSQIKSKDIQENSLNVVLLSSYNTNILKKYIANALAGKSFIKDGFIIDESLKFKTLKNPQNLTQFKKELGNNSYSFTSLTENVEISPLFFVSRFINDLSNNGVNTTHIYIILLLPIFLTIVGVSKHLVGLSTLGSIIPVFITLLYFQSGIFFTLLLFGFLLVFNILISRFISKYTLLYTPKVTFITILNLLVFMIFYQVLASFNILEINVHNILYVILFFIVSEKLITIITSKEFTEYKRSLIGTLIVSLICYGLFHINTLLVFLMAYPEVLIILVPLNFLLGRFTGLRITEYLRFREIVKSIEE